MRGQQGPCLAPGNSPAARRYVRSRKPPPIILWSIGIITCLLFIGAAAMLTVGYLNPFGTVGLSILGVGAVVYFGAIFFLVLSCLWVERKYPGMQPLSFKIYSRKPNRMPPTTFTNPHMSGQMPADTTPAYRIHNEMPMQIPGFNNVAEKKIPSTPKDKSQETNDNNPPSHGSSQDHDKNPTIQSTALDVLPEEDYNGGISKGNSPNNRRQKMTNNNNVTMNEETRDNLISSTGMKEKSQCQPEQNKLSEGAAETHGVNQDETVQHNQNENDNNVSSPKREQKVKLKTHHIEVPFEDYPSSDSSKSQTNKKDKSQEKKSNLKKPNPKDNSQHMNSPMENGNASKSTSTSNTTAMDKQKEVPSSVNKVSHAKDTHLHQRAKPAAHSAAKDIKQGSSNLSNTEPTDLAIKQIPEKHKKNQDSLQLVRNLTPANSASTVAVTKTAEHESHASKPANSVQKDTAPKASPVSHRKLLNVQKDNAKNSDHALESVQEKSQTSSLLNIGTNMLAQNNNLRHEQQDMTSPKHRPQNPGSPSATPTRVHKMQSPDRARKMRKDNAVPNSPPINRNVDASSSPTRHHKKPDHFSKAERTQEQSITIQTFSSSERKEEVQKKKILHSSTSSQSSDLPSSSSSSSPSRQRHKSPNKSPRLPRNGDHISRTTTFHSSRHSSPSSQSSDVPSSPSSSPSRIRQKSPDLSTKMQRHKQTPVTSVVPSSSNKKDELHKRHSQPSLQSSDVLSSSTSSPLSAKQLLQNKKEQTNQNQSVPQKRTKE